MCSVRQLLRDRRFSAYFVARLSLLLAFSIEDTAVSWQVYSLRHHAFDLGLVGLILFVPQLVLALPAGTLADRFDRRKICVYAAIAEAAGLLAFVGLILAHERAIIAYFAAVAFVGIAHATGTPAARSLLARIVPPDRFVRAQAMTSSATQLITIAGPAVAGALIAASTALAFFVGAAAYVLATVFFALLPRIESEGARGPALRAMLEGVQFIARQKVVLGAISLDLFAVLFGGATALLPIYATTILHVGATGFGALRAAPAAGAAIVAIAIARRPLEKRIGPILYATVFAFGIFTIVFGVSRNFVLSLVALALTGGFDMVSMVIRSALVQLTVDDAMRGRVGAVENVFIGASNELGAFESGMVASAIGAPWAVVGGGLATIAVIAVWWLLFPQLRDYDRLVQEQPTT